MTGDVSSSRSDEEGRCSIVVAGAAGRMGRMAVEAITAAPDLSLVGTIGREDDFRATLEALRPEIVLDVTTPEVGADHLDWAIERGVHPIVGTTGMPSDRLARAKDAARAAKLGGIVAPNFALGAVLMIELAKRVAPFLDSVEIIEAHHPAKRDAPSGTAARTRQELQAIRGDESADVPIHSVRLPGYIASQEVIFGGAGERLSIRHDTLDRTCFAPGILLAARRVRTLDQLVFDLASLLFAEEERCASSSSS